MAAERETTFAADCGLEPRTATLNASASQPPSSSRSGPEKDTNLTSVEQSPAYTPAQSRSDTPPLLSGLPVWSPAKAPQNADEPLLDPAGTQKRPSFFRATVTNVPSSPTTRSHSPPPIRTPIDTERRRLQLWRIERTWDERQLMRRNEIIQTIKQIVRRETLAADALLEHCRSVRDLQELEEQERKRRAATDQQQQQQQQEQQPLQEQHPLQEQQPQQEQQQQQQEQQDEQPGVSSERASDVSKLPSDTSTVQADSEEASSHDAKEAPAPEETAAATSAFVPVTGSPPPVQAGDETATPISPLPVSPSTLDKGIRSQEAGEAAGVAWAVGDPEGSSPSASPALGARPESSETTAGMHLGQPGRRLVHFDDVSKQPFRAGSSGSLPPSVRGAQPAQQTGLRPPGSPRMRTATTFDDDSSSSAYSGHNLQHHVNGTALPQHGGLRRRRDSFRATRVSPSIRGGGRTAGTGPYVFSERFKTFHTRDFRQLDATVSKSTDPAIVVRRHVTLVKIDPVRAVVFRTHCWLLLPDGADDFISIVEDQLRDARAQDAKKKNAAMETDFEMWMMDVLLKIVQRDLSKRLEVLKPEADNQIKAMNHHKIHSIETMRIFKNKLDRFGLRLRRIHKALDEVLDEDEDLVLMHITRLALNPLLMEDSGGLDESELILESHLQDINELLATVEILEQEIENAESTLTLQLDASRNKILLISTFFSIITTHLAIGALVAGFYGMNIPNGHENDETSFFSVVTGVTTACLIISSAVIFLLLRRMGVFQAS